MKNDTYHFPDSKNCPLTPPPNDLPINYLKRLFGAIMCNIEDKCRLQNYRNIVRESKKSTNRWSFDQDVGLNTEWYFRFMVLLI